MQILLANAKIMFGKADRKPLSAPLFQSVADTLAAEMARMDVEELGQQLDCSKKIAAENWQRYQNFVAAEKMPILLAYNGQAYKHLRADTLGDEALDYVFPLWSASPDGRHSALSHGALCHDRSH